MYVLGIDFGGGASKATLLRSDGKVVATAKSEYKTLTIGSEGREQRPDDYVLATVDNIRKVLSSSSVDPGDIDCICFDAATHTAVLLDEDYKVVRNSVYWTDTRSVKQKEFLEQNYGEEIFKKFFHRVDTIWTLPELMWVKENEPDVWAKVRKVTFAKDYVRHFFTGDFVTDYIEAEGSLFFDYATRSWDEKYLGLLGLNRSNMPKIVDPLDVVGKVSREAATISGLREGTKVICGSTDTAMEVFASGAVKKGQMTVKIATAGRICLITDELTPDKNLVSYSHLIDGLYYPGTATKSCAASLRWFRDTFGGNYEECSTLASNVPLGSDGLIFSPYLNGELTPYADPKLRGSFVGVSALHTKGHFIRSVMEGTALSLKDCKEYLLSKGKTVPKEAFILGGGSNSDIWKRIVTDVLDVTMISTENNDSSFGSAMCAGIAVGMFRDFEDAIAKCQVITSRTEPIHENVLRYEEIFRKYKKVSEFLTGLYNEK